MDKKLLLSLKKPARYISNEVNSAKKDLTKVDLKFALIFPDTYEIGMSNLGMNILYGLLNERADVACERAFAPWFDYEELLKKNNLPLASLENSLPLNQFDVVGFSLQYELCYSNVLNILNLGGIKLYANERDESAPIIIGGGPICYNPEPAADFFDAFLIGDGEEAVNEICDTIIRVKKSGGKKKAILEELSKIQGVYIPSFFDITYHDDGRVKEIIPLKSGYSKVTKRVVRDLNKVYYPKKPIVPFVKPVHDRFSVEIARGCMRGCRFCHAGYVYRPYRERSCESIMETVTEGLQNTGYEEVSLLSLSAGDFSFINPLMSALMESHCEDKVALSLPSVRPGTTDDALLIDIKKVRKTGFTLAPEAGSERLRRVINKDITDEELFGVTENLFKQGWRNIKLYFMIGLPFETMDDVKGIVELSSKVREIAKKLKLSPTISVSVSNFTPKGHTPFQFAKQEDMNTLRNKQDYLRTELKRMNLGYKWHDLKGSFLEGVFSRGDRRLAKVIKRAWELGAKFDEWSEVFDFSLWQRAFEECGIDPKFYLRERSLDEVFPYDHIDTMVDKSYLIKEYGQAKDEAYTTRCAAGCFKCGVCGKNLKVATNNIFIEGVKNKPSAKAESIVKKKMRFEYTKVGEASFIGHLDMQLLFIRALSRAGIKCDFSKGFHPMPKLSFGSAIPTGLDSVSEFAEVEILNNITPEAFAEILNENLPSGMKIKRAMEISFKARSLFESIAVIKYEVNLNSTPLKNDPEKVQHYLKEYNDKEEFLFKKVREEKTKIVNVKEYVDEIDYNPETGKLTVLLRRNESGELSIFNFLEALFNFTKDDILQVEALKTESIFNRVVKL